MSTLFGYLCCCRDVFFLCLLIFVVCWLFSLCGFWVVLLCEYNCGETCIRRTYLSFYQSEIIVENPIKNSELDASF